MSREGILQDTLAKFQMLGRQSVMDRGWNQQSQRAVVVLLVVPVKEGPPQTLTSSRETKRSGKSEGDFKVLNCDSEYGSSCLRRGREWVLGAPKSCRLR